METALGEIIGPVYLIIGLSVIFYPKQYVKIIADFEKNHLTMYVGMIIALIIGLIIVNTYNIWEWNVWIIITLTGWLALLKAVIYFLAPGSWIKAILKAKIYNSASFLMGWGVILTIVGAALSYYSYLPLG